MNATRGVLSAAGLVVALVSPVDAQQAPARPDTGTTNVCESCHAAVPDQRLSGPVAQYREDVHAGLGFGCVECHGGDATAAGFASMDPAKGFIGRPAGRQLLQVCGRCHSDGAFMRQFNPAARVDQVAEYQVSIHGQRLLRLDDPKVATCISCHPAHRIRPPDDARSTVHPTNVAATCGACHADSTYMQGYGIPTNQVERYRESVHWHALSEDGDLSAPTCNDCHGNHGAAPPGVEWVGNVCGQCHSVMETYFASSRHAQVFTAMGIPGCAVCHSNHAVLPTSDDMLGLGEGAVCARCHVAGQGGGLAATSMREAIDSLRGVLAAADSVLGVAERAGMEVSEPQFDLESAQTAILQARTAVHTFVVDSVVRHVDEGVDVATVALDRGHQALADLRFRRIGLGLSTGVIVLLIASLVLKIWQLERQA